MNASPLIRVGCGLLALLFATAVLAQSAPPIAVLGFELVDEQPDASQAADLKRRLAATDQQFREALSKNGLYTVVDRAPAGELLAKVRAEQEFLYRCNGCLGSIGKKLDVRLVAVGWVQKVSNLILNLNVEIWDTQAERMVLTKSVDLRGNTDESWSRAVAFMVRDMTERRQGNPKYGI